MGREGMFNGRVSACSQRIRCSPILHHFLPILWTESKVSTRQRLARPRDSSNLGFRPWVDEFYGNAVFFQCRSRFEKPARRSFGRLLGSALRKTRELTVVTRTLFSY